MQNDKFREILENTPESTNIEVLHYTDLLVKLSNITGNDNQELGLNDITLKLISELEAKLNRRLIIVPQEKNFHQLLEEIDLLIDEGIDEETNDLFSEWLDKYQ